MVWAKYGLFGCVMAVGVAVAMMGLDGYLRGAPEAMIGATLGLGALGLLGVRFVPSLVAEGDTSGRMITVLPEDDAPGVVDPAEPCDNMQDAESVRLVPMVDHEGGGTPASWLGGAPRLAADTSWPELDGVPGVFLAQIDCAALPTRLWGGLGPRHGALAVFRFAPTPEGAWPVRLLHVTGPLNETGVPAGIAPCPAWPLDIVREAADTDSGEGPSPDWQRLHAVDLSDPAFQPFDWVSASILLGRMQALLTDAADRTCPRATPDARAQLTQTARRLAELAEGLRQARAEHPFSAELRTKLVDGVSGLTLPTADSDPMALTDCSDLRQAYFSLYEGYCRLVHADPASALPAAQQDLFLPLWAHSARHESAVMGDTASPGTASEDAVLLLELPSSELLGWSFGTGRSFRVFVSRDALVRGDLTGAWATVAE